jgi:hypothetical protein
MLIKVLLAAGLISICYQDIRYRAVYWYFFPLLAVLLLADLYENGNISIGTFFNRAALNAGFTGLQLILLYCWLSLRSRRWVNLTRDFLGIGDILFILCLALYLHPVIYIAFYILSLVVALILALVSNASLRQEKTIPLAGWQAAVFLVVLIIAQLTGHDLVNNTWSVSRYL